MKTSTAAVAAAFMLSGASASFAQNASFCQGFGPQSPRDIAARGGTNKRAFPLAPAASAMNLCNLHFHKAAEHKGADFKTLIKAGSPGFRCDASARPAELKPVAKPAKGCDGVQVGDTIEVHWVFSSCDVKPGVELKACAVKDVCENPVLRVESQVFLLVNGHPTKFSSYDYAGRAGTNGLHQPKALPPTSRPASVYRGSTTKDTFSEQACSPLQVTWSVRPTCSRLDINSLHAWCADNAFKEHHAHGVRPLVTRPELLSRMD